MGKWNAMDFIIITRMSILGIENMMMIVLMLFVRLSRHKDRLALREKFCASLNKTYIELEINSSSWLSSTAHMTPITPIQSDPCSRYEFIWKRETHHQ